MAEHHELVAEMPILEQMGTQDRQKLAKKRRNQQLKRWNQREKEWLAKEKQVNKRLASKISEENNGLNLKQYTTFSSNHRSKKTTLHLSATATGATANYTNNINNNNNNNNNNDIDLKTVTRFQTGQKAASLSLHGRVHFNVGVMLLEAAARNDYDEVKRLLMLGVSPNSVNHDGLTALHQCCIDASEPIMNLLLEFGAEVDARDTEQWTPLHAACTCGHLNLVKILVENGANLLAVNGDGNMPFDICEDEETLDYIETEMLNRGITQEMIDITRASTEMQMISDLEKDLENGAEYLNRAMDHGGVTPLHVAAANGYVSVVKFLIEHGADVNVCDNDLWTPLHGAACWGSEQHFKAIKTLVEAGARLDAKTSNDETVLDLCENQELLSRLQLLKSEIESKQVLSTEKLKRTQSKTNSRIHSIRRVSVRDKNQLSRREAREEALLRVDSNPILNDAVAPMVDEINGNGTNTKIESTSQKGSKICTNENEVNQAENGTVNKLSNGCEQTDLDQIVANGTQDGMSSSDQIDGQRPDTNLFQGNPSQEATSGVGGDNSKSMMVVKSKSSSSDKGATLDPVRIKISSDPMVRNAQKHDSQDINNIVCDGKNNQHIESAPIYTPVNYTLSNLKKQRSDIRMRTTCIGGSTSTIIVANGSIPTGLLSLNPKSPSNDPDATLIESRERSDSPSSNFRKFSGEPSEVIGESRRIRRDKCCIVM